MKRELWVVLRFVVVFALIMVIVGSRAAELARQPTHYVMIDGEKIGYDYRKCVDGWTTVEPYRVANILWVGTVAARSGGSEEEKVIENSLFQDPHGYAVWTVLLRDKPCVWAWAQLVETSDEAIVEPDDIEFVNYAAEEIVARPVEDGAPPRIEWQSVMHFNDELYYRDSQAGRELVATRTDVPTDTRERVVFYVPVEMFGKIVPLQLTE